MRLRTAVGGSGRHERKELGLLGTLRTFWRLQPGGRWRWSLIWVMQNVRFAPIYLIPLMTGHLIDQIDRADPGKAMGLIPLIAGGVAVLCAANVLGDTGARYLLARIARGLTASLRFSLIRRLDRVALTFHDRMRLGELELKFTQDLNRLESFQHFLADSVLMNLTTIVVMSVIIYHQNPLLLGIIVIGVLADVVLIKGLWRHLRTAQEGYRTAEAGFMHTLNETLMGLRVTRAHATEDFVESRVKEGAQQVARRGLVLDSLMNLFGSTSWAITTMLGVGVIFFGVWLVVAPPVTWHILGMEFTIRAITLGEFTVLLSYYGILTGSITSVVNNVPAVAGAQDAIISLSQLYHEEDEDEPAGGAVVERVDGRIDITGVSFSYPKAASPAIDGVSLHIPAGTSLALVGPSGGGKSTLANLVLGLYRPDHGGIAVDGRDLGALDLRSLRRHCSVVSQDVVLFNDTILANIAWGDAAPDEARARRAAEQANALEFIDRLADGLHHRLGDRGIGLSGGQRQRLALARALYRDPRILILDEATSALDSESERLVQKALDQAMRSRTTIVIAHRLSTIRGVDRVAVLVRGRIAEQGGYEELVARGGIFAGMVATAAGAAGVAAVADEQPPGPIEV